MNYATTKPASESDLLKVLDLLRELTDQVSFNASADDLQSFPMRDRQIERADKLRGEIDAFRAQLSAGEA
jgi:hypothetical protein